LRRAGRIFRLTFPLLYGLYWAYPVYEEGSML
jgi:hypothetical protein